MWWKHLEDTKPVNRLSRKPVEEEAAKTPSPEEIERRKKDEFAASLARAAANFTNPTDLGVALQTLINSGYQGLAHRLASTRKQDVENLLEINPRLYFDVVAGIQDFEALQKIGEAYEQGRQKGEQMAERGQFAAMAGEAFEKGALGLLEGAISLVQDTDVDTLAKKLEAFATLDTAKSEIEKELNALTLALPSANEADKNAYNIRIGELRAALADEKSLAKFALREYNDTRNRIAAHGILQAMDSGVMEGYKEKAGFLRSVGVNVAGGIPNVLSLIAGRGILKAAKYGEGAARYLGTAIGSLLTGGIVASQYGTARQETLKQLLGAAVDPEKARDAAKSSAAVQAATELLLGTIPLAGIGSGVARSALVSGAQEAASETLGTVLGSAAGRAALQSAAGEKPLSRFTAQTEQEARKPIEVPSASEITASAILGGGVGAAFEAVPQATPQKESAPAQEPLLLPPPRQESFDQPPILSKKVERWERWAEKATPRDEVIYAFEEDRVPKLPPATEKVNAQVEPLALPPPEVAEASLDLKARDTSRPISERMGIVPKEKKQLILENLDKEPAQNLAEFVAETALGGKAKKEQVQTLQTLPPERLVEMAKSYGKSKLTIEEASQVAFNTPKSKLGAKLAETFSDYSSQDLAEVYAAFSIDPVRAFEGNIPLARIKKESGQVLARTNGDPNAIKALISDLLDIGYQKELSPEAVRNAVESDLIDPASVKILASKRARDMDPEFSDVKEAVTNFSEMEGVAAAVANLNPKVANKTLSDVVIIHGKDGSIFASRQGTDERMVAGAARVAETISRTRKSFGEDESKTWDASSFNIAKAYVKAVSSNPKYSRVKVDALATAGSKYFRGKSVHSFLKTEPKENLKVTKAAEDIASSPESLSSAIVNLLDNPNLRTEFIFNVADDAYTPGRDVRATYSDFVVSLVKSAEQTLTDRAKRLDQFVKERGKDVENVREIVEGFESVKRLPEARAKELRQIEAGLAQAKAAAERIRKANEATQKVDFATDLFDVFEGLAKAFGVARKTDVTKEIIRRRISSPRDLVAQRMQERRQKVIELVAAKKTPQEKVQEPEAPRARFTKEQAQVSVGETAKEVPKVRLSEKKVQDKEKIEATTKPDQKQGEEKKEQPKAQKVEQEKPKSVKPGGIEFTQLKEEEPKPAEVSETRMQVEARVAELEREGGRLEEVSPQGTNLTALAEGGAPRKVKKAPQGAAKSIDRILSLFRSRGNMPKEIFYLSQHLTRDNAQLYQKMSNAVSVLVNSLDKVQKKLGKNTYDEAKSHLDTFLFSENEDNKMAAIEALGSIFDRANMANAKQAATRLAEMRESLAREIALRLGKVALASGQEIGEETARLFNKIADTKTHYKHRAYIALAMPKLFGKRFTKKIMERFIQKAKSDPSSQAAQIYNAAKAFIIEHDIAIPVDELDSLYNLATQVKDKISESKIREYYGLWINPVEARTIDLGAATIALKRIASQDDYSKKLSYRADSIIRELVGLQEASETARRIIMNIPGSFDALNRRTEVPQEIRNLLMEVTDPVASISATLAEQTAVLSRLKFTSAIYEHTKGVFWETPENQGKVSPTGETFSVQLNGPQYGALNGMYVTPELADAISGTNILRDDIETAFKALHTRKEDVALAILADKGIRTFSTISLLGKILSITTNAVVWILNSLGSVLMTFVNGNFNAVEYWRYYPTNFKRVYSSLTAAFSKKRLLTKKELEQDIIHIFDNPQTQALTEAEISIVAESMLRQINDYQGKWSKALDNLGIKGVFRRAKNGVLSAYAALDATAKLYNFIKEREYLIQVYKKEKEARGEKFTDEDKKAITNLALTRSHYTNISYHLAPPIARVMEKSGIMWFATYMAETYRSVAANLSLAVQDLKEANLLKSEEARKTVRIKAAKRMVGATTTASVANYMLYYVVSLIADALDSGGDDEEKKKKDAMKEAVEAIVADMTGSPVVTLGDVPIPVGRLNPLGATSDVLHGLTYWLTTDDSSRLETAVGSFLSPGGPAQLLMASAGFTNRGASGVRGEWMVPNAARDLVEQLTMKGFDRRTATLMVNGALMFTPRIVSNIALLNLENRMASENPDISSVQEKSISQTIAMVLGMTPHPQDFWREARGRSSLVANSMTTSASNIYSLFITGPARTDSQAESRKKEVANIVQTTVENNIRNLRLIRTIYGALKDRNPREVGRLVESLEAGFGKQNSRRIMRAIAASSDEEFERIVFNITTSWLMDRDRYISRARQEGDRTGNRDIEVAMMKSIGEILEAVNEARTNLSPIFERR